MHKIVLGILWIYISCTLEKFLPQQVINHWNCIGQTCHVRAASTSHPKIVETTDADGNLVEYEYYYEYVYEDETTQPPSPTPPPSSGGDYNYDYYESSKTGNDWLSDR